MAYEQLKFVTVLEAGGLGSGCRPSEVLGQCLLRFTEDCLAVSSPGGKRELCPLRRALIPS